MSCSSSRSCGDDEEQPAAQSFTVAERLAAIDEAIGAGDYDDILDRLAPKCTEGEERLGDFAVSVREQLADAGVELSLLEIMREALGNVDTFSDATGGPVSCVEPFGFVVLDHT